MAHGFLGYEPVSGESPLVNFAKKKLKEGLKGLWGKFQKTSGALVKSSGGQVQYDANPQGVTVKDVTKTEPVAKKMLSGSQPKMLGAGTSAITKQEPLALPGGSDGGIAKKPGGTFTDIPGISSGGGLNADTFFKQATTGVGSSGEYLTNAQRREAFIKSRQESEKTSTSAASPPISPDSGVDIVAAVNRNTQMIVSLVDAVKAQTSNDTNLVQQQIQTQETLMLRSASAQKEAALEKGGDYSGFMTPENFQKKKKQEEKKETGSKLKEFFRGPNPFQKPEGCGCSPFMPGPGGGGGILGGPPGGGGLPIPDYVDEWRDMNRRPGSRLGGGASVTRRTGGARRATRLATKVGGKGAGKAVAKGVGKGLMKKIPVLGALAGGAFAAERAMSGDWLGAGGELLSGIASIVPGVGTAISTGIDAGLMARDAGITPFAEGGIVSKPTLGLLGESPGAPREGVFPLEGPKGRETFQMFGEGVFQAQKDNDKDFAKLQSMGMKQYYEREGGFKKMGEGLKSFFESLAGGIASLFGGAANAATLDNYGGLGGGGDFSGSSGQDQAMNYFMSQGLSKDQAAGIVGNLMQESGVGIDPNAKNATGHRGIAQWDKNRWSNFEKWAKKKGLDVNTREAQLQWIMEEMRTGDGGLGIERFKKTKTAAEAAALFVKDYERSGEKPGQAGYDKRISNANALATRQITGGGVGNAPSQSGLPQLPPTGHIAAQKYGASRDNGGRKHAGTDFDIRGNETFVSRIGGEVIKVGYDASGYGKYADIYNAQMGVTERIAEGANVLVREGQKITPGTPVARGETKTGVIHYEIRKGRGGYGFSGTLDPIAFLRSAKSNANVAQRPGGGGTQASVNRGGQRGSGSSPGSLQASAANANDGTPMMAASQQVAMGTMGLTTQGGGSTIINNYYGGGQQGGVNGNGVSPGIGMEQTGTAIFQDLRIRALA